jgi:hypothetical protein
MQAFFLGCNCCSRPGCIEHTGIRLREIVRDFLHFSRRQAPYADVLTLFIKVVPKATAANFKLEGEKHPYVK